MENIVCPKCNFQVVKSGVQNGNQRYKCKRCNRRFQDKYCYKAYEPSVNTQVCILLKEGCGIRSISRIIGISSKTVLSRMLKIANRVSRPIFNSKEGKYEIDELWSFIGNKSRATWVTYCIERESKRVVDFFVGSKCSNNIRPLVNSVLELKPNRIYMDRLNIYPKLIPKEIHKVFRYSINIIERNNLTLRTHVKRLSRRTICFSKKQKYLEAHLRIYFWDS
jgi:IS1 family transposase/transposase-like protein